MPEEKNSAKKNYLTYGLIGILVVAAFAIGSLYTKVQTLEKGGKVAGVQEGQPTQPAKVDVKVTDDDPQKGPKNAKITIVNFSDFQCPFCGAYSGHNTELVKTMQQRDASWQPAETNILKEYVDSGKARFVWKDYPFLGQESMDAAAAARCAQDQGKFWEYHDYLFGNQKGENEGQFSKENLKKFAATLKLNTKDFNNCVDTGKYANKVKDAITYGQSVGVSGTPATFVNGNLISGAAPFATFKTAIEEELKKK